MFKFKKNSAKPLFSEEHLSMEFPNWQLAQAETVGEFEHQGRNLAYARTEYILFDNPCNPTSAIVLTSRKENDFDPPVALRKNATKADKVQYVFKSNGKLYFVSDDVKARSQDKSFTTLKDLLLSNIVKNKKAQIEVIKDLKTRENIAELFSRD